jgi:hypothetical protein
MFRVPWRAISWTRVTPSRHILAFLIRPFVLDMAASSTRVTVRAILPDDSLLSGSSLSGNLRD